MLNGTDRGVAQIGASTQEPEISMVDQPLSRGHDVIVTAPDAPDRVDRSMDALQYVLAFLAIVAAALLASLR
jgi:hypothetical protein